MTVELATGLSEFDAPGSLTVFTYDFRILEDDDLFVFINGVLQTLNIDYTIQNKTNTSGQIAFVVAPPAGVAVRVERRTDLDQEVNFQIFGPFAAQNNELVHDKPTLILQEVISGGRGSIARNSRNLTVSVAPHEVTVANDIGTNAVIPGWDGSGIAGMFHGEHNDEDAPEDGTVVTEDEGYTWMVTGDDGPGAGPYPMMEFAALGVYDEQTGIAQSNQQTFVCLFRQSADTGGSFNTLMATMNGAVYRVRMHIYDSDNVAFSSSQSKLSVRVHNSAFGTICHLHSINVVADGLNHLVFFSFDGDTGNAIFYIDGVDADDVTNPDRVAPTTGTMYSTNVDAYVGGFSTLNLRFDGKIGFCGMRDAYLTNPLDFMTLNEPKTLDEVGWTEWGAQPDWWHKYGTMESNAGAKSNMNITGTITGPTQD